LNVAVLHRSRDGIAEDFVAASDVASHATDGEHVPHTVAHKGRKCELADAAFGGAEAPGKMAFAAQRLGQRLAFSLGKHATHLRVAHRGRPVVGRGGTPASCEQQASSDLSQHEAVPLDVDSHHLLSALSAPVVRIGRADVSCRADRGGALGGLNGPLRAGGMNVAFNGAGA